MTIAFWACVLIATGAVGLLGGELLSMRAGCSATTFGRKQVANHTMTSKSTCDYCEGQGAEYFMINSPMEFLGREYREARWTSHDVWLCEECQEMFQVKAL